MELCPQCHKEILPYLKTGEVKQVYDQYLISYQCWYCINCRIVFYIQTEQYKFVDLEKERKIEQEKREAARKAVVKKAG